MWKSLYILMTPIKIYTKYLYFLNESIPKQYGLNFSIKQEDNSLFYVSLHTKTYHNCNTTEVSWFFNLQDSWQDDIRG